MCTVTFVWVKNLLSLWSSISGKNWFDAHINNNNLLWLNIYKIVWCPLNCCVKNFSYNLLKKNERISLCKCTFRRPTWTFTLLISSCSHRSKILIQEALINTINTRRFHCYYSWFIRNTFFFPFGSNNMHKIFYLFLLWRGHIFFLFLNDHCVFFVHTICYLRNVTITGCCSHLHCAASTFCAWFILFT